MITEYLVIGAVLIGISTLQLWLNGLWPFRSPSGAKEASEGEADDAGTSASAPKRGDLWRSWTRIVGYVGLAAGVFVIVLGAVRA